MVQYSAILPNFRGHTLSSGPIRLHLLEPLGSGAHGTVYLAHDRQSLALDPVYYAVKCLLRHPKGSDQDKFQKREIATHKAVSYHPHVATLHTVIEEEHFIFLVMDYCPGGDLFSAIIDRQSFANNDERVKRVFVQLLDAVHTCHDHNIFHRDLKPENILCSKDDDDIYVADFGLATKAKLSLNFGCGSSFYMSPECVGIYAQKRPYSASHSDVWSLGVILTNLITGRSPWHVASPHDDPGFRAYIREGAPYLRRMLPISFGASEILERVFELNPLKRITINELRRAVLALDTFFLDVPDYVRQADIAHAHALRAGPRRLFTNDSVHTDIQPLPSSTSHTLAHNNSIVFMDDSRDPRDHEPVSFPGLFSASSSGSESSGPATPETQACVSGELVPDMTLEHAEEGQSNCEFGLLGVKANESRKTLPRWQRFVGAVHRMRVRA